MDFSVRGGQPHHSTPTNASGGAADSVPPGTKPKSSKANRWGDNKALRIMSVILLFAVTVLLIAIAFSIYFGGNSEAKYVNGNEYQAVDISVGGSNNSDQIYFGKIKDLSASYLVLEGVYYIPASSSSSSVTLEPLVCQIDKPYDQMIVNRSSVNWWENLQSNGKVASSIAQYEKQNPNGPTCPTSSSTSPSSSNSSTSNSTSNGSASNSTNSSNSNTSTP